MYEAVETVTQTVHRAKTVEDLRDILETCLSINDLPDDYHIWSNSRCIAFLVQAGYVIPHNGPDWFMNLAPRMSGDNLIHSTPNDKFADSELIRSDGTVSREAATRITFWQERNQVRFFFTDDEQVHGEVFMTEESARKFWAALGRCIGFDDQSLYESLKQLPQASTYYPKFPPQSIEISDLERYNILRELDSLDLDLPDPDNYGGESSSDFSPYRDDDAEVF